MDFFHYQDNELYCEEVPIAELAAEYGTPLWVYSQRTLLHHFHQIQTALPVWINEAGEDARPTPFHNLRVSQHCLLLNQLGMEDAFSAPQKVPI